MVTTIVVSGQGVVQLGAEWELNRVHKLTTFISNAKLRMTEEVLEVGVKCLLKALPKLETNGLELN